MTNQLNLIYQKLYTFFGPQYWWPADSAFEVIIGAVLTQNTNWSNVEKAVNNLKKDKLLEPVKLYKLSQKRLAAYIKPSGYYNIKAKRLKDFLDFFFKFYQGNVRKMAASGKNILRQRLLSVKGIGPETADSILLYALGKPIFVIDTYTKRILLRHRLILEGSNYEEAQNLFMRNLRPSVRVFNEYHALLVRLAKEFCLKNKPDCQQCPLRTTNKRMAHA
ncbi:endonuclease III domain-containing protein [bacterium]|nr:MAG: endonuclease III domain-containing protein [bacterium]